MTVIPLPTTVLVHCVRCDRMFDQHGKPFDLGQELIGTRDVQGVTSCPGCQDEVERETFARRLSASGLPAALRPIRFTDADNTAAASAAREWGAGSMRGVMLCGPVGAGKTHLAAAATTERLRREAVRWVSVPSLIQRALAAIDSDERRNAVAELTSGGPIVLDDLDKVKPSEWVLAQLFVAIDSRVQSGAALFVTTNLGPKEIANQLGEAIASRLAGHCAIRRLDGRDRRLG